MKLAKKRRFAQDFSGPGKTQQNFRESTNVNNIVSHYLQTGIDPYLPNKQAEKFGFATSQSYLEAMRNVAEVNSAFADLPATERSGFSNDPSEWLKAIATPPDPDPEIIPPESSQEVSPEATPETLPEIQNEGKIDIT